ncbi:MAG: phospho-N-acetylmuramoyl-pentapeptide-transferase [Firmicutes bacterium]|nr:phospho-N-acetylmuramoyl-pentapeptide-transferase [Bacillota bacterium]
MWFAIAFAAALALSAALTKLEIPMLIRLKTGQNIREEGPQGHLAKAGTPSMGGLAIIAAACIVGLILMRSKDMAACCLSAVCFGFVGFLDDYLKIVKHQSEGLKPKQKMGLLLIFAILLAVYGYMKEGGLVAIPLLKRNVSFGIWYIPFAIFAILAMTNAVNLTDGLDGLASSVTALVAACMGLQGLGSAGLFAFALSGACLGFFWFNKHPAKLFMGDTGSLALGGALAAIGICNAHLLALPIAGAIYVAEALSVIIQVYVFKTQNGRRFFRMAPLHHHFELGGWKETKVVGVFAGVTAVLCVLTILIF